MIDLLLLAGYYLSILSGGKNIMDNDLKIMQLTSIRVRLVNYAHDKQIAEYAKRLHDAYVAITDAIEILEKSNTQGHLRG